MSNELFTDVVTLFNHYDSGWIKTILKNVQWTEKQEKNSNDDGIFYISKYVDITIPYMAGYIESQKYKGKGFTFGLNNLDFIVYDEIPEDITDSKSLQELKSKYNVYTIYGFSDNTYRKHLKHWRVIAK